MGRYDVIAVPGGGLYKAESTFLPATYEHDDQFGMLGGHMRVAAAVGLYMMRQNATFLFSGGSSAKQKAVFGQNAPVESEVYRDAFLSELTSYAHNPDYEALMAELPAPQTVLDPGAENTARNMEEMRRLIRERNWRSVAVLSNEYHVPRAEAWWNITGAKNEDEPGIVDFLSAEDIVRNTFPDVHDASIAQAYQSPMGLLRLRNEAQGLSDIAKGRVIHSEFQLVHPH